MASGYVIKITIDASGTVRGSKEAERSLKKVFGAAEKADKGVSKMEKSMKMAGIAMKAAIAAGAIAAAIALRALASAALKFGTAIREVGTLIGGQADELRKIEQASLGLAAAYGTSSTDQAKSFYQAISAGASSAAEATEILDVANRLAIGGVTDVTTGVDGLTSVLNAYGLAASEAESVSDALFVAMKLGKTTVGELVANIGNVAPIAAQAGVGFESLLSAVAALTKGGISTNIAMTGLRAMLVSVIKPTKEAAEFAKELGIEFNVQALQAKGLEGVLKDVKEATGGEADAIARLFSATEALTPALALMGKSAGDFAVGLREMETRFGATNEGFRIMTEDMSFQLNVLKATIVSGAVKMASALADSLLPAITSINENLDEIKADALTALGVAFDVAKVAAISFTAFLATKGIITVKAYVAATNLAEVASFGWLRATLLLQAGIKGLTVKLSAAMAAIGPAGWVAIGVGAIVTAFILWKRAWEDVDELIDSSVSIMRDADAMIDDITKSTKKQRDEQIKLTKAKIDDLEVTLLVIEAQITLARISNGQFFGGLLELLQSGRMGELQGAIIGLENKLRDLHTESEKQTIVEELAAAAEAADDLAGALTTVGTSLGTIPGFAGFISGVAADLDRFLELFGKGLTEEMQAAIKAFADQELQMIVDVEVGLITTTGDQRLLGGDDGAGGDDVGRTIGGGVVQLVNAMEGLDDLSRNLVSAFSGLASAMSKTEITANDWITLVVQIILSFASASRKASKEAQQAARDLSKAFNDLRTSLNELEEVTTQINVKYDEIVRQLGRQVTIADDAIKANIAVGESHDRVIESLVGLTEAERKRALELEMATRRIQQKGFAGLITMFEDLGVYLKDTEDAARFAQTMQRLQMELEIINFRIQLDMLKSLGTIAQETLDWIEGMIDTVEAGLRSGEFTVGGAQEPVRRGGGRRPSGGPSPRETLQDMLDTARDFAGIMEDTFGDMATHFAEMREHVGRMRLSEEERAMRVAEIAELERQASEQYGLTLLERVAQATGNEEMLRDLELIRFEVERAHTLSQIELLLASGTLSEEMADNLRQAAVALGNFDFGDLSSNADAWDRILESQMTSVEQLSRQWDEWWDAAYEAALAGEATQEELEESWNRMRQSTALMALGMIEAAARAAGNEDLARRAAEARFNIERAIQLGDLAILRAQLVVLGGFAELIAMLDEAIVLIEGSNFVWDPWTDEVRGPGGGIVGAIEDQTDSLLAGWQNLIEGLLTGPDSPLTPAQRVEFLQSEYDRLFALARSGDQDAEAQLQQMIPSLVSAMSLFTGGTATTAFNDFFAGLMADIAMLSGLANPLGGLGFGAAATASTDNIIGSFRDFQTSAESSAGTAHNDAEDLKAEFRSMTQRLDLVLAQQGGAGSS